MLNYAVNRETMIDVDLINWVNDKQINYLEINKDHHRHLNLVSSVSVHAGSLKYILVR